MRGGVEKLDVVYSSKSVNLKYKTDDSSFMNRARGFMDKFQEGTFSAVLSFDEGALNKDKDVFKKSYTIEDNNTAKTHFDNIDVSGDDKYYFTLIMNKEKKTFKVKFTLTVKKYRIYLDTHKVRKRINNNGSLGYFDDENDPRNWETKFNLDELLSYEITYSDMNDTDTDTGEKPINSNGGQSIIITSDKGKKYTFPFPIYSPNGDNNYSFFSSVLDKCKEKVYNLMKTEIGKITPIYTINTTTTTPTPTPTVLQSNDNRNLEPSGNVYIEQPSDPQSLTPQQQPTE
jgi:hypothetical protein